MSTAYLGIDIAKLTFDIALLSADGIAKHKKLPNTPEGFAQLDQWLAQQMVSDLHVCMEATGHYGHALAHHLHQAGWKVSVVNPAGPSAFARSQLSRTKTDKADARRIAQFCQSHTPKLWTPPDPQQAMLQALVRRLESLGQMYQAEKQRLEGAAPAVVASLQEHLSFLEGQIASVEQQIREHIDQDPDLKSQQKLLESIPGIGAKTASVLLAELGNWQRFDSARAAAAYVGVVPRIWDSGTSVHAPSRMCKIGNARLRKALYWPAVTAVRHNPVLKAMKERMRAAGKSEMAVIGAAMRRLVHLAFGVLKSGKAFDARVALRQVTA